MALQSTVASIQNIRKQRQLELELVELDRQWHLELKALARERLTLLKDLCRIQQDQRTADHLPPAARGPTLVQLTDAAQARLQRLKDDRRRLRKYDFQPDPVEKMPLTFPPLDVPGDGETGTGGGELRTAQDLYNHRVQLQKSNFEQCVADRRSRRRPFWDKAVLGEKKKRKNQSDRLVPFPLRVRNWGPRSEDVVDEEQRPEEGEGFGWRERLSKSPSLPALNTLRRFGSLKPATIHPSLSSRHSASLDYLPVLRDAAAAVTRGRQPGGAALTSLKAPSVVSSVSTLPTIDET